MTVLHYAAPLLLVDDLDTAIQFYTEKLGFSCQFVYDRFYAAVARDQSVIHLKCASKTIADRSNRQQNGHLDVYIEVDDAASMYEETTRRQATITQPLMMQAWQTMDFQVTDPDGYVLCFSSRQSSS